MGIGVAIAVVQIPQCVPIHISDLIIFEVTKSCPSILIITHSIRIDSRYYLPRQRMVIAMMHLTEHLLRLVDVLYKSSTSFGMQVTRESFGVVPRSQLRMAHVHILRLFDLVPCREQQLDTLPIVIDILEALLLVVLDFDRRPKILMPVHDIDA